jgi:predicted nucleotidyltransferase
MASAQSLGGRARAKRLTRDERRQIARRAARARWTDPCRVLTNGPVIQDLCRKYRLRALYAFGSILTPAFRKESDVDLLYVPEERLDYAMYCEAVDELSNLFGRRVDFIERALVEGSPNEFRRRSILAAAKPIYEAHQDRR